MKNKNTKEYLLTKKMKSIKEIKVPNWINHMLFVMFGIFLIVVGSVEIKYENYVIPETFKSLFVSFGQAFLVGMTISIILDLPYMKQYYKNRIVDVLVGDEYLTSLSKEELEKLRTECTEKIYIKDTTHFDESLLELDEKITKMLSKPYISQYRSDIICTKQANGHIHKKTNLKYWLVNPSANEAVEIFIGKIWLHKILGIADNDIYKILKFKIKIDDDSEKEISSEIKISIVDNMDSHSNYGYQVTLTDSQDKPLEWKYKTRLEIEIEDDRLIPSFDNIYTKRINDNPIKNLHITYKTIGMDCRLEGTCMGTLAQASSGQFRVVRQDSSISIESFSWLLPGNGIIIATLPR